ncbi:MAG TPA: 30S ribosomal protein S3 [Candidatus Omnitrophica bacterium]|nr:30S ribosomal protein S3 [Candidatus Omnitrophota bacterium]
MGHKVHPFGYRLGYIKKWNSRWFSTPQDMKKFINEDHLIRKYVKDNLKFSGVSVVEIERYPEKVKVIIHTARPGVIIGRRGSEIDRIQEDLQAIIKEKDLVIDIKEVKNPEADAQLAAENVALQIEKRVSHRRAMKRAMQMAMEKGAKGIKINCSGRLSGNEIARRETYKLGKIPLQTLRADIDYGFAESRTTAGLIGVKVWIYKGDAILEKEEIEEAA